MRCRALLGIAALALRDALLSIPSTERALMARAVVRRQLFYRVITRLSIVFAARRGAGNSAKKLPLLADVVWTRSWSMGLEMSGEAIHPSCDTLPRWRRRAGRRVARGAAPLPRSPIIALGVPGPVGQSSHQELLCGAALVLPCGAALGVA